jgi:hypothetical protein
VTAFLKAFFATATGQELYKVGRDAIEAALTVVFALNLAIPGDLTQAKAEGLLAFSAVAGAVIAVVRREFLPWLVAKLGS